MTSLTLSACNMQKFVWLYGHNAPPYWVKHSDISKDSQAQSTTNVSIMQSCASLRHNNGVPVAMLETLLHALAVIVTLLPFYHMHIKISKCRAMESTCVLKPQDDPTTCTSSEDATELLQCCKRLYSVHLCILFYRNIYRKKNYYPRF